MRNCLFCPYECDHPEFLDRQHNREYGVCRALRTGPYPLLCPGVASGVLCSVHWMEWGCGGHCAPHHLIVRTLAEPLSRYKSGLYDYCSWPLSASPSSPTTTSATWGRWPGGWNDVSPGRPGDRHLHCRSSGRRGGGILHQADFLTSRFK